MPDTVTILPLLGSLRSGSYNRMALQAARRLAPEDVRILEAPDLRAIEPYDDDLREHGFPAPVVALRQAIAAADAILFVSPEYNYSIPGLLKNAIDWASRAPNQPFRAKPVGIMGASRGPVGTARMQYHLRQVLVFVEAHPVNRPEVMIGNAAARFDADGNLIDETTATFIRDHLRLLADWTRRIAPR
jgi:chromate reductase, NAD(P)H dehydrogenase (quinone)